MLRAILAVCSAERAGRVGLGYYTALDSIAKCLRGLCSLMMDVLNVTHVMVDALSSCRGSDSGPQRVPYYYLILYYRNAISAPNYIIRHDVPPASGLLSSMFCFKKH